MRSRCLLLLLLWMAPEARAQEYTLRHYSSEAGLPTPVRLAFDGDGTLVIGTEQGLYHFDGRSFEPMRRETSGRKTHVVPSPTYGAWYLWSTGQQFWLSTLHHHVRTALPRAMARALLEGPSLVRYVERADGTFWSTGQDIDHPARGGYLWEFAPRSGVWRTFRIPDAPDPGAPTFGPDGTFWLSDHARVGRVERLDSSVHVRWSAPFPRIYHLVPHPKGGLWVLTEEGVFHYRPDGTRTLVLQGVHVSWHSQPALDAQARLLFYATHDTTNEVMRLTPDGRVDLRLNRQTGLTTSIVRSILPDREGGLFIAHDLGLSYLDGEGIVGYRIGHASQVPIVRTILGYGGPPVFGTWEGIYRVDGARTRPISARTDQVPTSPTASPDGTIHWFERVGARNVPMAYRNGVRTPLASPYVLYEDAYVRLTLSDTTGFVQRRQGAGWTAPVALGLQLEGEQLAARTAPDRLWLRLKGHLDVLAGDSLASTCRRCVPSDLQAVLDEFRVLPGLDWLQADAAGRVWFSAEPHAGVLWQDAQRRWQGRILRADEIPGQGLRTLFPRASGHLWLGTDRGLFFAEVSAGEPHLRVLRELHTRGELPGDGVSAVYEDTLGHVWAYLQPGFLHRITLRALDRLPSPRVVVTRLEVDGQARTIGALLRLPADRARLDVGLRPASYRGSSLIELEYRLLPADANWVRMGDLRTVRAPSLPPGRHVLEVRSIRSGLPPGPVLRVPIVAVPPWWRRLWVIPLLVLLAAAPVLLVSRARQGRRLALERLRLRIATDLHDDLGSGLTQVALYSDLIHARTDAPVSEWALTVGETARATLDGLRDIVWSINPTQESPAALLLRLKDHANGLFSPQGIAFTFEGEEAEGGPTLPLDVRRNVLLIGKEALHNAARHAGASRVAVRWHRTASRLRLTVEDDGRGFLPDTAHSGAGLASMRRRAEEIGATLDLNATPGKGTHLTLDVPI